MPRGNLPRPPRKERQTDTTFVETELAGAEPEVSRPVKRRQRTVVADENDQRILIHTHLAQTIEEAPNLLVILGQHAPQILPARTLLRLRAGHPGRVWIIEPEIDESRLLLVATNEIERLIDEERRAIPALHLVLFGPDPIRRRNVRMRL